MAFVAGAFALFVVCQVISTDAEDIGDEPVDIVYLYVNGSDPSQQEVISSVSDEARGRNGMNKARFRDWDELRYSVRSLFRNLRWFRRVHLVVRNNSTQVPTWMDVKALGDRLRIVTHDMIFTDPRHLPTASSRAIEANVHRIPGVSRRFVLMNDDFFIWRPIPRRLLLPTARTHYVCLSINNAYDERSTMRNPTARELSVQRVNSLLNGRYGYHSRRDDCHAPQVIDVALMQQLQDAFPAEFEAAVAKRARTGDTIAVRYMYNQWVLDTQKDFAVVSRLWTMRNALSFPLQRSMLHNRLHFWLANTLRPYFVATNDEVPDDAANIGEIQAAYREFCTRNFPQPSPVERS